MTRSKRFILFPRQRQSPKIAIVLVSQLLIVTLFCKPTFGFLQTISKSSPSQTTSSTCCNRQQRRAPSGALFGFSTPQRTTAPTVLSMMKGSVFIAVTLDGFIATTDGDVSFLNEFGPDEAATSSSSDEKQPEQQQQPPPAEDPYSFENFLSRVDVIIMGRKTFEKVLSFGRDMWAYGTTRLVVWTTHKDYVIPDHLQESVSCSTLSPTALWDDLQNQGYEHAYIDGGTTIAAFGEADLIEDWILTRVPLVLGQGIPLFSPAATRRLRLNHVHTQSSPTGLVTSHYQSRRDAETEEVVEGQEAKQEA